MRFSEYLNNTFISICGIDIMPIPGIILIAISILAPHLPRILQLARHYLPVTIRISGREITKKEIIKNLENLSKLLKSVQRYMDVQNVPELVQRISNNIERLATKQREYNTLEMSLDTAKEDVEQTESVITQYRRELAKARRARNSRNIRRYEGLIASRQGRLERFERIVEQRQDRLDSKWNEIERILVDIQRDVDELKGIIEG